MDFGADTFLLAIPHPSINLLNDFILLGQLGNLFVKWIREGKRETERMTNIYNSYMYRYILELCAFWINVHLSLPNLHKSRSCKPVINPRLRLFSLSNNCEQKIKRTKMPNNVYCILDYSLSNHEKSVIKMHTTLYSTRRCIIDWENWGKKICKLFWENVKTFKYRMAWEK